MPSIRTAASSPDDVRERLRAGPDRVSLGTMRAGHPICRALAQAVLLAVVATAARADEAPIRWQWEFPRTDFSTRAVPLHEIRAGGPDRDGIPSIDDPKFEPVTGHDALAPTEPVIGLKIGDVAKAYPLRILIWHEIVNDEIAGMPVVVTYFPLCNTANVFVRRVEGRVLEFGTTGKLRKSDLVMYDRQTQSWWQQFTGTAIVGEMTGARLEALPARLESFKRFRVRAPHGEVLVPSHPDARDYGSNPYVRYDSRELPFPYFEGSMPQDIRPMARVVVVDGRAWSLALLRAERRIVADDLVLRWSEGQNSALDAARIADGRDVGNVVVQRRGDDGALRDVPYDVIFAFVYHAFHPDGRIVTR